MGVIVENNASIGADEQHGVGINPTNDELGNSDLNHGNEIKLGFGVNNVMLMCSAQGTKYTAKLAGEIKEQYKENSNKVPRVSVLDKEIFQNLAYSTIVVSLQNDKSINYFTLLLEGTGEKPLTAEEITNEIEMAAQQNRVPEIFTPDDAINNLLHEEIVRVLKKEYNMACKFIPVDGMVVPNVEDTSLIANICSVIAFNACWVDAGIADGSITDLNIAEAKSESRNADMFIEINKMRQTIKDELGNTIRADFQTALIIKDRQQQSLSLNAKIGKTVLAKTSGFIDSIPEAMNIPTVPGSAPVQQIRLRPYVVIDNISIPTPTTGFAILGLISGLVMTNRSMFLSTLMPVNKADKRHAGALNLITNLDKNQNGVGGFIDLTSSKITNDKAYAYLSEMYSLDPVVALDVPSFGPQTNYQSIFATAAKPGNSNAKHAALKEIVTTCSWLTGGNFPSDFPVNDIFQFAGVTVPTGKWLDKSGERDIRDVDLAFVAAETNDVATVNAWAASVLPNGSTNGDSFLTKVKILSKLIPDAVIEGKATRVTFSSKFILALTQAAAAAGLNPAYKPETTYAETTSISMLGNYFNGAGIGNAATSFARESVNSGPTFNTLYSGVGYGRH